MSASWNDHFHIVTSASPGQATTTGEWTGGAPNLKPKVLPDHYVIASPRRALDGTFYAHTLQDDAGVVVFTDWNVLARCDAWTDVQTWRDLLGQIRWFINHYHDAAVHNSYTQRIYVDQIGEPQVAGPQFSYTYLPIHLVDASQEA